MLQKWKRFAVAVGTLGLFGLVGWQSAEHVWGTHPGVKYRMSKVERGDMTAYVSATGTLNPVIMVQVGTQVSGTIEKLFADFNSTVVPGQQLAQLDQARQFHEQGAIGSHLENLERNEGFKGFNQTGVSEIISATDPRKNVRG